MEDSDKFMAILIPDQIEKELDRSDRFDEKIDRAIKRLLQVKLAKQLSRNTRTKPQSEPRLINPPASVDVRPVENGKLLVQAAISVSPDKTETHNEIAPAQSGKEHFDEKHVKVEVFTKPRLFPVAEMERFLAFYDACRGNEDHREGGGFNPWV
jgi:hypothetical protein